MSSQSLGGGSGVVVVTGVAGQDGYFLAQRLLAEGHEVHGIVRDATRLSDLDDHEARRFVVHEMDLLDRSSLTSLVRDLRPNEVFNMAGQSSVSVSFADPETTWKSNVEPVVTLLEAIRRHSPTTRLYQSSSSEMFGSIAGGESIHDERSALSPLSPYAAAKAAAHVACAAYRASFDLRIACGILFNHESSRRSPAFLSRKVVDHVAMLRRRVGSEAPRPVLRVGNLHVRRDWGFAPDFVDGILLIARQVRVRSVTLGQPQEPDEGGSYRDYVLGTGRVHAVRELVDRALHLGGFPCAGRANPQTLRSGWRITRTPVIWRWRSTRRSSAAPTQWPSRPIHHGRGTSLGGRLASGWIPFLREMLEHVG